MIEGLLQQVKSEHKDLAIKRNKNNDEVSADPMLFSYKTMDEYKKAIDGVKSSDQQQDLKTIFM